jgi:glycosyltransferase involved in cell wall biosynthesis
MEKKFSVIVITHNAGGDLKECLGSIKDQDYAEKEVIVVDDASTDGTAELLRQFKSDAELEMTIVTNKENLGVAGSRNVGIRHASGDIIAFTDSDCVADRRWIAELARIYDQTDAAAVGGRILDDRIDNIWTRASRSLNHVSSAEGRVSYIQGCNMSFGSKILRKYLFNDEIKYGYEETLLCDYLIEHGYTIFYTPRAVVHHRHKADLPTLLKQKYMRGLSSVWYRKKQNKFFVFKRHFIFFTALLCVPFISINRYFLYLSLMLFLIFSASLIRDEIICGNRRIGELIVTYPFIVFIELFHFLGSCAGLVKFRFLNRSVVN